MLWHFGDCAEIFRPLEMRGQDASRHKSGINKQCKEKHNLLPCLTHPGLLCSVWTQVTQKYHTLIDCCSAVAVLWGSICAWERHELCIHIKRPITEHNQFCVARGRLLNLVDTCCTNQTAFKEIINASLTTSYEYHFIKLAFPFKSFWVVCVEKNRQVENSTNSDLIHSPSLLLCGFQAISGIFDWD